jgi:putative flippase GtrA
VKNEIIKYFISGALAFTCDFAVLYFCTEFLGFHYLVSNIFGYFVGLMIAYTLNVNWVFSYRKYKKTWLEFAMFNIIVLVGLGISESNMALLVEKFEIDYLYAKVIVGFVVMVFNYTAKKFILFHPAQQTTLQGTSLPSSRTKKI